MTNQSALLQLEQLRNARYRTLLTLREKQAFTLGKSHSTTVSATDKRTRFLNDLELDIEMMEDGVDRVNEAMESTGAPNSARAALRVSLRSCICSLDSAMSDGLDTIRASDESRLDLEQHFATWKKSIAHDRTRLADM